MCKYSLHWTGSPEAISQRCIFQTGRSTKRSRGQQSFLLCLHFLPVGHDKTSAVALPRRFPMAWKHMEHQSCPIHLFSVSVCGTRRDSTSCPATPPLAFREGQSLKQRNTYTSVLSLCLRSHIKCAVTTNISVEPRYGPQFLWNCCLSTCFFKSELLKKKANLD